MTLGEIHKLHECEYGTEIDPAVPHDWAEREWAKGNDTHGYCTVYGKNRGMGGIFHWTDLMGELARDGAVTMKSRYVLGSDHGEVFVYLRGGKRWSHMINGNARQTLALSVKAQRVALTTVEAQ